MRHTNALLTRKGSGLRSSTAKPLSLSGANDSGTRRARDASFATGTFLAIFVMLAALVALPSTARADDEPANQSAALAKFDDGRKALEAGDFATALAAFDASNRLLGSPNSVLYMARCYKGLGKTASAYTSFRLAYKQAQDRLVATSDKRYAATRDSAAKEAAEIEADVPKLAIAVPDGANASVVVTQNGTILPRSSWGEAIDTDPGHVVVEAKGSRLETFREELELPVAETRRIDVKLVRVPTATLHVTIDSRPLGLSLRLDGVPVELAELAAPRDVDPGPHYVEATAPGHMPFRWDGRPADGEKIDVKIHLSEQRTDSRERRWTTPKWMFWTTAGAAAATLVTGTVLASHASIRAGDERDLDPLLRSSDSRDSIRNESTVANVFFVSGAVLATGAVVLAFTTDWRGREGSTTTPSRTSRVVDAFTTGARF